MNDTPNPPISTETVMISRGGPPVTSKDSSIFGVSVRAWIASMLIMTVCTTHLAIVSAVLLEAILRKDFAKVGTFTTIGEPLYSMSIAALAFYFGQKSTGSK